MIYNQWSSLKWTIISWVAEKMDAFPQPQAVIPLQGFESVYDFLIYFCVPFAWFRFDVLQQKTQRSAVLFSGHGVEVSKFHNLNNTTKNGIL